MSPQSSRRARRRASIRDKAVCKRPRFAAAKSSGSGAKPLCIDNFISQRDHGSDTKVDVPAARPRDEPHDFTPPLRSRHFAQCDVDQLRRTYKTSQCAVELFGDVLLGLQFPQPSSTCLLREAKPPPASTRCQSFYAAAESQYRRRLSELEESLPQNYEQAIQTRDNIAIVLRCQGQFAAAEAMQRKVLSARAVLHGGNHPRTLGSMSNLAVLLYYQQKYSEAEELLKLALRGYGETGGAHDTRTLACLHNLALLYQCQLKHDNAHNVMARALEESRRTFPVHHPRTLASLFSMAWILRCQSRHREASALFREAHRGLLEVLGPQSGTTQVCRALELSSREQCKGALTDSGLDCAQSPK
jgi:tetratricopeptide (TPR) repeat protein